ncbi:AAA family ATPase [Bifidobacterium xylocopae]|uniref:AAA family ATPase n=1 Tax=Bifidobacterium xylocopae TaxID=2493119 RepID=UPI00137509D9|nr:MoxR family ATPase [Bifidobacterium xylocopae]
MGESWSSTRIGGQREEATAANDAALPDGTRPWSDRQQAAIDPRNPGPERNGRQRHTTTTPGDVGAFRRTFDALLDAVGQVVIGKERAIRLCLTALIAGGHILLEDEPGTGKTQLARAMGHALGLGLKRVQFTPDLLPSDLLGVTVFDQASGSFSFRPGPVFTPVLLADEINRASPKVQSALLEVMEEGRVSVDGISRPVGEHFLVIASQNSNGHLGTYALPEAELDRFMLVTSLGPPGRQASMQVLRQADIRDRADSLDSIIDCKGLSNLRNTAVGVHCAEPILEYITRLLEATRHSRLITSGASIRGGLALVRGCKVWAASQGRDYVTPDDVQDLLDPALAHRIRLGQEARMDGVDRHQALDAAASAVPVPPGGEEA